MIKESQRLQDILGYSFSANIVELKVIQRGICQKKVKLYPRNGAGYDGQ